MEQIKKKRNLMTIKQYFQMINNNFNKKQGHEIEKSTAKFKYMQVMLKKTFKQLTEYKNSKVFFHFFKN